MLSLRLARLLVVLTVVLLRLMVGLRALRVLVVLVRRLGRHLTRGGLDRGGSSTSAARRSRHLTLSTTLAVGGLC